MDPNPRFRTMDFDGHELEDYDQIQLQPRKSEKKRKRDRLKLW